MNQMKKEKRPYITPTIELVWVNLEQSIANSSSTVNIGGSSTTDAPLVENWKEETSFQDLTL